VWKQCFEGKFLFNITIFKVTQFYSILFCWQGIFTYRCLRNQIDLINHELGSYVLIFYVSVTAYYCELPDVLNDVTDFNTKSYAKLVLLILSNTTSWVSAAEFHSNVRIWNAIFENWILSLLKPKPFLSNRSLTLFVNGVKIAWNPVCRFDINLQIFQHWKESTLKLVSWQMKWE